MRIKACRSFFAAALTIILGCLFIYGNSMIVKAEEPTSTGEYCEGVNWDWYEAENKLVFRGTGAIASSSSLGQSLNNEPFKTIKEKTGVTVEIQSGITSIEDFVFSNHTYMGSVSIADTVTRIGKSSFYGCEKLKEVIIPDSVTELYGYAFKGCSDLESVTISNNIEWLSTSAFEDCPKLTEVSGGNGLTGISENVFNINDGLIPEGTKVNTHVVTTSDKLKDYAWTTSKRIRVCRFTMMDYTGENLIAQFDVPSTTISDYSMSRVKSLMKEAGLKDEQIPKGINRYSWYNKANGIKKDMVNSFTGFYDDKTLYGMPMQLKDGKFVIDVSDGKTQVIDSREMISKGLDIQALLLQYGMIFTAEAMYADLNEIDLKNDEFFSKEFSEWMLNKKFYISPIPASSMSKNEKFFADSFFGGVVICTHATLEPTEDSLFSFVYERKKDDEDNNYTTMTFESVKHDGIETKNAGEFGAFTLASEAGDEYDGMPVPIEQDEKGFSYGYQTLAIEVTYGQPVEATPTPAPTPTPTPETTPSATPGITPTPAVDDDITKEIPFAENVPVEEKEEVIKNTDTDKNDVEGSTHQYLKLKAAKTKKTSIKISWKAVTGADGYIIYGNRCGKPMERITVLTNPSAKSYTFMKLKKGTYYKYLVVAYKTTASGDKVITTSKSVHAVTLGGKYGNPTSLKVKKTKVTLKKGKKAKIKASFKKKKKFKMHIAKFRYESTNTNVATVDKKGRITAKSKGTANIYVYTQNGICKTIKVKVK